MGEQATANFCGGCGRSIQGERFCTNCGTPSGTHQAITPELLAAVGVTGATPTPMPREEPPASTANGNDPGEELPSAPKVMPSAPLAPVATGASGGPVQRGAGRWALIGGLGAAIAAVVAVVVLTLFGGEDVAAKKAALGPDNVTVYKRQVAKVFGPVLGANLAVSDELAAVRGTKPDDARLAVRRAQEATTQATGALSALTVPAGQDKLAADAKQVIGRDVAYLAAVASVLNHPTVAGASQLQALESDLTAALTAAGPGVAGEQNTVSGATRLTAWARTTSRTLNRRAAAKRARARANARAGSVGGNTATSSTSPASSSRGTSCGGGLYAGPNTSCTFARNVRDAYWEAPGASATVRVHSPVTNQTYTMSCSPSGSGITCSGGNNASVTF